MAKQKFDIYAAITERIIAELEKGIIPWEKPWIGSGVCRSHNDGRTYSLLNQMLLGRPGEWATYDQIAKAGGQVRKGEKSSMVVFWTFIKKIDEKTKEPVQIPFLRYYNVFHIDQCDGITPKYEQPMPNGANSVENADAIIRDYCDRENIRLTHEAGDRAYYRPSTDSVTIPIMEQFKSTAEYYSTIFHELTHSTGHEKRLNRLNKSATFGTKEYSKEELVAEIGAATLLNHAMLETVGSFRNSAAYIQSWLKVLENDKRFIVSAAGRADKAVNLILGKPAKESKTAGAA